MYRQWAAPTGLPSCGSATATIAHSYRTEHAPALHYTCTCATTTNFWALTHLHASRSHNVACRAVEACSSDHVQNARGAASRHHHYIITTIWCLPNCPTPATHTHSLPACDEGGQKARCSRAHRKASLPSKRQQRCTPPASSMLLLQRLVGAPGLWMLDKQG